MVLSKDELVGSLQNEVRILLHLCGKVESEHLDYRPTPKQRSTLELLRYLSFMGPVMVAAARDGGFDTDAWVEAQQAAEARNFSETVEAIAAVSDAFAELVGDFEAEDFATELEMFGRRATKGAFLVNTVLGGYAAYRTQLFLYLKSCGREELNTMNLWAGMDAPVEA